MPLKKVPVLLPGRYVVRGYDGRPRVKVFTPKDAITAVTQGNAQIKAGLRHPLCWMHDPNAEPEYLSHSDPEYARQKWIAKGYFGEPVKYYAKGGKAYAVVNIPDEKDAAQFEKVGTVSPSLLHDWIDERGKLWPGLSILHIGSTPIPVQRDLPRVSAYRQTSLSRAVCLSISIPTGSPVMADELDTTIDDGDTGGGDIAQAVDLLKKLNPPVVLSGDITDMKTFLVALETSVNTLNGGEPDGDEMDDDMDDMGGDTEPVSMPQFMSRYLPKAVKVEEDAIRVDIKSLVGKVDAGTIDRLTKTLDKANLSHSPAAHFTPKGEFKALPDLRAQIEAYKLLPVQTAGKNKFGKTNMGHTVPVSPVDRTPGGSRIEDAAAEVEKFMSSKGK
jgi:hypothetical protein